MGVNTINILSEESIRVYLTYMDQLKKLFTQFNHDNLNQNRKIVRTWRDIEQNNQQMIISAFLKMCRILHLIPNALNIESLQELLKQTITPMTNEEYDYLEERKELFKTYADDSNPASSKCYPKEGEPGLYFHEFTFLLALIALNCSASSAVVAIQIENFFVEKLGFKKAEQDQSKFKSFD